MQNMDVAKSFYYSPNINCKGSNFFVENRVLYSYGHHFIVAMCLGDDYILLNGDTYSPSTSTHQSYIRQVVPEHMQIIIPFSALRQAIGDHTEYYKIRVIDNKQSIHTPYTYINTKGEEKIGYRHTLGGSVFEFNGRYFISGIDETGVNRLYFLTELVCSVDSFDAAIEALKPEIVKDAEKWKHCVKRQGEWFFVPDSFESTISNIIKKGRLPGRNGDTGHHIVSEMTDYFPNYWLVRGIVKHDQKEHKQLKLYDDVKHKKWWVAVHNVQIQSWSAGGNVD